MTNNNEDNEKTLRDYLLVLGKYKKAIVAFNLILAVVSVIYSLMLPNIYRAKAMLVPSEDDKGMMGAMLTQMGGLASMASSISGPTKSELYITILKSDIVKDAIIDRFKFLTIYKVEYRADAYELLDKSVAVQSGKKDGVLTITFEDEDPVRAAAVVNAYVEELGKMATGLSMTGAAKSRQFLEKRLAIANSDLAKAEDAMKLFQRTTKAVAVTEQAKASIDSIAQLRGQLATKEVQLSALQRQFTEHSQEVKLLRASIESIKTQIAGLEGNGANRSIPTVGEIPQLGQEYVQLLRELKIQETVVELLTKQYEMTKISESKDISPFQIIQTAKAPERKSGPVRSKIVKISVLASLLVSLVGALAYDALSTYFASYKSSKLQ